MAMNVGPSGGSGSSTASASGATPAASSTGSKPAAAGAGSMSSGMVSAVGGGAAPAPSTSTSTSSGSGSGGGCDLSGRWMMTVHKVTDGLGNLQTSHNYFYYELAQTGDALTVKKSMLCGTDTIGGGDFAITVDFKGAFPSLI